MKCSLGFFTPIWEKSWFSGRITAPSTTCQQREHRQVWCCSVFPWLRRLSSRSEPYLIDWYSSFGILLLQVPHCADLVSARATNEVHIHTWFRQTFTRYQLRLWLATCTVPEHGVTIWAEAERGHCTVVTLQHAHTLAGPQVPHPNAAVHGGGEELQPPDVWVKLDQAGMRQRNILNMKCFRTCPITASGNVIGHFLPKQQHKKRRQVLSSLVWSLLYNTRWPSQVVGAVLFHYVPDLYGAITSTCRTPRRQTTSVRPQQQESDRNVG